VTVATSILCDLVEYPNRAALDAFGDIPGPRRDQSLRPVLSERGRLNERGDYCEIAPSVRRSLRRGPASREQLTTNLGVGRSNRSGRASRINSLSYHALRSQRPIATK
jgi:hypothetical protein